VRDAALDGVAAEASSGAGGKQRVGCSALSLGNPVPHHVAGERQEWCPPFDMHVILAGEPGQPGPQVLPVSRHHPAPLHLPGHGVQTVERQLPAMDVLRSPRLLGRSSAIAVTPAGPEWESDDEISQKITSTPRGVGTRVRHRVRPGPPIVAECVGYERRLSWSLVGNSSALRAGGGRVLLRLTFRPAAS